MFRYQLICPALDDGLSRKAHRLVREIASREHTDPFGTPAVFPRPSLTAGSALRAGGFRAWCPVRTWPRTDTAVLEMAAAPAGTRPANRPSDPAPDRVGRPRTMPDVPSPGTDGRQPGTHCSAGFEAENPKRPLDRGRSARPADRRAKNLSVRLPRMIIPGCCAGYRFGFAEDAVRLGAALGRVGARRVPAASVYVDNGSAFTDSWLLRACAKLGIRLVHSVRTASRAEEDRTVVPHCA